MKAFLIILNFLLLLTSTQSYANQRDEAGRRFYRAHDYSRRISVLRQTKGWSLVNQEALQRAFKIPSQPHGRESLRDWSCGPNSVARALQILDKNICTPKKECDLEDEFEALAKGFPKGLGTPVTKQGAAYSASAAFIGILGLMKEASPTMKFGAYALLALGGVTPYVCGYMGWNAGAPPGWIIGHLKELDARFSFGASLIQKKEFKDIRKEIEESLSKDRPLMPLVVFDILAWHYFLIVGHNESSVLVLDTNGAVAVISYKDIETLMNPGYLKDDYWGEYLFASMVASISHLGPFNLIRFH